MKTTFDIAVTLLVKTANTVMSAYAVSCADRGPAAHEPIIDLRCVAGPERTHREMHRAAIIAALGVKTSIDAIILAIEAGY